MSLRIPNIASVSADEWSIVVDQFERITKAQWCELYYHLYQAAYGQECATFIVDDIQKRIKVINSHCDPFAGSNT